MLLHGMVAYDQFVRDCLICQAFVHQLRYSLLCGRKRQIGPCKFRIFFLFFCGNRDPVITVYDSV